MVRPLPDGYTIPPFPSLHWNLRDSSPTRSWSLFRLYDIWRFTVAWTLIFFAIFHLGAAALALVMHMHGRKASALASAWRYLVLIPLLYVFVAAAEAFFTGSVVGLLLGAIYGAGSFTMNTWIPFVWGLVNVLVLVISSFSIQGGL